ncbi:MAG TPA: DUF72 domain-containing protein [Nitrososphaeraceae archaeon]|nr:DUF72 domain-containing protein [Nitrososphaeraceae archaeon]
MDLYIGCSGWSYSSWEGPFYPSNIDNKLMLTYYSKIFDYVEIDSTFYNIPSQSMVKNWNKRTPNNFRFTVKFPKIITHEKKFRNVEKELSQFYENMEPLKDKILALLIQLPPSYELKEGLETFRNYDFFFDNTFRYAIEVRHSSWFSELAYNMFRNSNISLVWSQMDVLQTPPVITTDFIYLRLIGDRSIQESNFGKLQRDRSLEMKGWTDRISQLKEQEKSLKIGIVAANNHYGGFGPGTVNMFREMLNLEPKSTEHIDLKEIGNQLHLQEDFDSGSVKRKKDKQTTISDFV